MGKRVKAGYIVAIDGPAGAGKSTVSRLLASELQGRLLDTGAMYRSVAYFAVKMHVTTASGFSQIAKKLEFDYEPKNQSLLVNGIEMGQRLRTQSVSSLASKVSAFKGVRQTLTARQRTLAKTWAKSCPVVVEGRDIGTVVFPEVEYKFYVTADPKIRAERRYQQLKKQGAKGVSLKAILKSNIERDKQDSNRKHAPLKCAQDAIVVDTSKMSVNQVVQFMSEHIRGRISLIGD
ncbi:MAG: (d)CMP kinase [Deltaproteobacteria bacterium]|nr:(d)CMP kinase [Deltaproteobacteria bacterium]MBM4316479.1 (d)CMP kinase [Deltaproteobacteria bacterium]